MNGSNIQAPFLKKDVRVTGQFDRNNEAEVNRYAVWTFQSAAVSSGHQKPFTSQHAASKAIGQLESIHLSLTWSVWFQV